MNIVAQNHTFGEHLSSKISCFLEEFHVGKILKACNAYKVRGFSVSNVFVLGKSAESMEQVFGALCMSQTS